MSYSFANIKILIVDDEELIREILSEAFTLYGASVDLAESGFDAVAKIQKNTYDMVITDIRMPNGDGIYLLENIKKLESPRPKLFVCSAYNDLSEDKIKELGILKIFTKPFELGLLLNAVASFSAVNPS